MTPVSLWLRQRFLRVAMIGGLVAAGLVVAAPAQAHDFGSTACASSAYTSSCVSLGDNATHTWYPDTADPWGNNISGIDVAFQDAMDNYETFTDLTTSKVAGSPTLDVMVTDYDYASDLRFGWTACISGSATSGSHPYLRCDRQKIRFNGNQPAGFNTYQKRDYQTCHEIGHTVGLREASAGQADTCMYQYDGASAIGFYALTNNDNDSHINANH